MLTTVIIPYQHSLPPMLVLVGSPSSILIFDTGSDIAAFFTTIFLAVISYFLFESFPAILTGESDGASFVRTSINNTFPRTESIDVSPYTTEFFATAFTSWVLAIWAISLVSVLKIKQFSARNAHLLSSEGLIFKHTIFYQNTEILQRYADAFGITPELVTEETAVPHPTEATA